MGEFFFFFLVSQDSNETYITQYLPILVSTRIFFFISRKRRRKNNHVRNLTTCDIAAAYFFLYRNISEMSKVSRTEVCMFVFYTHISYLFFYQMPNINRTLSFNSSKIVFCLFLSERFLINLYTNYCVRTRVRVLCIRITS